MKHLLIILLVFGSFIAKAEWIRGTITFHNGEEKTGYIRNFSDENTSEIEYKRKLSDEPVEIASESISQLLMRLKEGTMIAKYLYTYSVNLAGEYKPSKQKSWLRVVFRGDFDVMSYFTGSFRDSDYFVNWPGDEKATMIYIWEKNGVLASDKMTLLRLSVASIFMNKCDMMVESVHNGKFLPGDINDVLKYYVDNCKEGSLTETIAN